MNAAYFFGRGGPISMTQGRANAFENSVDPPAETFFSVPLSRSSSNLLLLLSPSPPANCIIALDLFLEKCLRFFFLFPGGWLLSIL